jgi:hypothetical protein
MEEYENKKFIKVKVETPKLLPAAKQIEMQKRWSARERVPSMVWLSSGSARESTYSSMNDGKSPV